MNEYDVIVVGAGNAALSAAASAREAGAGRVLVLEKAPEAVRGGNTHYSGGLFRFAFDDSEALRTIVPHAERQVPGFFQDVAPYPRERFRADLDRVTEGRSDRVLSAILIDQSQDAVRWLLAQGIEMEAAVSLSAIKHGDKVRWSPGAVVRARGEGVGLSRTWFEIMERLEVNVRYETGASELLMNGRGAIEGVRALGPEGQETLRAASVVLGCGGFEANPAWRARYLGAPWDLAKVRGTPYNTGDGLGMAFAVGAAAHGQYTGRHSTPIDADAPPFGDRKLTDKTNRLSYPFGVMINRKGERFVDEGEDFQFYTYAKMGGTILDQPGGIAFQIFDSQTTHLLEGRYKTGQPFTADTLEGLLAQLPVEQETARKTLASYNQEARSEGFDPTELDGVGTKNLEPPKSNWATPLDRPPFFAYPATGGITFTFGGLRIDETARVIGANWKPIPGLYACGEMVGGLFYHNYPGGAGLVSGAVFGRIAGRQAALNEHAWS
ncbi:MAG: FAD-dependent tricarballylate dehydrogenase TcuA [SAR324 cluster bacterium]|nr:FAD-dependent tricarballylate dehydrogenase TcuA [SAR324 cluster bacterium]